jgi:Fe-S oxidoreductase
MTLKRQTHAYLCLACGKCSTMCPLSPSGWFSAARMVAIRDPESEISGQRRSLDACLTCGACELRCPEGVHFADFVRGVRALGSDSERRPCPHGEMLQATARLMARGEALQRDLSWLDDDLEVAEEGELALFVGCLPFFDLLFECELGAPTLDIARAAIRLLNRLDIRPVLLADERCCGHDLLWNGEDETFRRLAEANAEAFRARGVETILTTCAECCRTWRLDYAEAVPGYRPRVEHLSEFLAAHLGSGRLKARWEDLPPVTFQDPCRLGRHLGVTDAPRELLRAVHPDGGNGGIVEMEASGKDARCCGTSGFVHCDANSRRMQSERLTSAAETGAGMLVTACPKCLIHFRCAQSEDRLRQRETPPIEVEDLTVLAAAILEQAPWSDSAEGVPMSASGGRPPGSATSREKGGMRDE